MSRAGPRLLLLALLCLPAHTVLAQTVTTASLTGRILDDAGGGLPGVIVTLSNSRAAFAQQSIVSGIEGDYVFKLLPPGDGFMIEASIPGYARIIAGPIDLDPGRVTVQNLTLRPAADLEETIRVEARGEIIDTTSTRTSTSFSGEFIEGLPILGRQFNDVLELAPGVTDPDGDGNPNVRGARDTGLQLRLDGTNITDPLTGHFGQDINLETIEEIEVITAGASAEYGRADGGFANVITKSGGNDTEGSFKVFFRSRFLDGDGANNEDETRVNRPVPEFNDTRIFMTLGGAMIKDRAWYFTSLERLDREEPEVFASGGVDLRTQEGWTTFGKLTWQADSDNKISLQINYDPIDYGGNFIGSRISPETDYLLEIGGPVIQTKWTSVLSPFLLVEALISHMDTGQAVQPVSSGFRPIVVEEVALPGGQVSVRLPCESLNCRTEPSLFVIHAGDRIGRGSARGPSTFTGPFYYKGDDTRERTSMKTDLSYAIEDFFGKHSIKGGFEFNDERYSDNPINNPIITDETTDTSSLDIRSGPFPSYIRVGPIYMDLFNPLQSEVFAEGLSSGAYLQDSWKPWPNLTVNLGLRFDGESIDSQGYFFFDPAEEAREVLHRFDILCDAVGSTCATARNPGRTDKGLTGVVLVPPGHPAEQFDLNGDGVVDLSASGEGWQVRDPLTSVDERLTEGFHISNANYSPRFSVSWDPWADGKTKIFGTWNKYYDRLILNAVASEQDPEVTTAVWQTSVTEDEASGTTAFEQAYPLQPSSPLTGRLSISQVDRDLKTPSTTEWSFGIERELAPEWALSLTYIEREGLDLLQDKDVNHITCEGFDETYGVGAYDVCGDGGQLELDRFGSPASGTPSRPNGAPDLYVLNTNYNQILRTGNYNSSKYRATELVLRKRLHRNWQMQVGYTYSKATGSAESFTSLVGNDPAVSDLTSGYLAYDQRHVLKWQGIMHLPREILLGGSVQWASGLPYSVVEFVVDQDDFGNISGTRAFFPTGSKNDQRNQGIWSINGRLEKRLQIGRTYLTGFLEAENLLDSDDRTITIVNQGNREGVDGTRRFGRRWEIGVSVLF